MSRFRRLTRLAAVGAIAASSLTLLSASPAGAAATGTFTADANGWTVTFANATSTDGYDMMVFGAGHNCVVTDTWTNTTYAMTTFPAAVAALKLTTSPTVFTFGSTIGKYVAGGGQTTTIAAGEYTVCVIDYSTPKSIAAALNVTIVDPNAPTTTTTAAPTTTTTAAVAPTTTVEEDPVTPAYAG